jgi:hypothetical protein
VTAAMIHVWSGGRIRFRLLVPAGVVAIFFLGLAGALRRSTWTGTQGLASFDATDLTVVQDAIREIVRRSAEEGAVPAIIERVPIDVEPLWGESYLAAAGIAVPRALWPGKPRSIDGRVGSTFFGVDYGIPPGGLGEAYWNFGVAGVVAVFLLIGLLFRWGADATLQRSGSPFVVVAYVTALWLLRGPGTSAFINWGLGLVQIAAVRVALAVAPAEHRPPQG